MKYKDKDISSFFVIIFLVFTQSIHSANFSGTVRSAGSEGLPNITVSIGSISDPDIIEEYTFTNEKGEYSLEYKGKADSVLIIVSGISIDNQSKKVTAITQRVDFLASEKVYKIKEVVIKSEKIWTEQDTINYLVSSFSQTGDQNIGDVLKRMPGILPLTENIYTYTDSISDLKWDILPEKAKYLDYKFQKAKTHFRGRDYIALFTTDIPCNNGPWKFCNLPGLILKVSDKDNFFIFEAISVLNANMPIRQYNWKSKSINKDTWYKMERSCHEKAGVYLKTHNINLRKANKNGELSDLPDDWTVPYNPIER